MEEYKGKAKNYEDAKLRAILAVLAALYNIEVQDHLGKVTILDKGKKIATLEIRI